MIGSAIKKKNSIDMDSIKIYDMCYYDIWLAIDLLQGAVELRLKSARKNLQDIKAW